MRRAMKSLSKSSFMKRVSVPENIRNISLELDGQPNLFTTFVNHVSDDFVNNFSPPNITFSFSASTFNMILANLDHIRLSTAVDPQIGDGINSLAADLMRLKQTFEINIKNIEQYAGKQIQDITRLAEANDREHFIVQYVASNRGIVDRNRSDAERAEAASLKYQSNSGLLYNLISQKINEAASQIEGLNRSINDLNNERRKYEWTRWIPGVGEIIYQIVEKIKNNERNLNDLHNRTSALGMLINILDNTKSQMGRVILTTTQISQSWTEITNKLSTIETLTNVISHLQNEVPSLTNKIVENWKKLLEVTNNFYRS